LRFGFSLRSNLAHTRSPKSPPKCIAARHKVAPTCALKNGGFLTSEFGVTHWHIPHSYRHSAAAFFARDEIERCVREAGGELDNSFSEKSGGAISAAVPRDVKKMRPFPNRKLATAPRVSPPSQPAAISPASQVTQAAVQSQTTVIVAGAPPIQPLAVTNGNAAATNTRVANLNAQIDVLAKVLSEQTDLQKVAADDQRPSVDKAIEAVTARLGRLKNEYAEMDKSFGAYLTSIRPNDRDLYLTARKASEIYPKIPYYIPGTSETGEFWVEPGVSDRGELQFGFKFVDANASIETVRETIDMSLPEIEDAQKALFKLQAWSETAHQQKLRKNYEKRVTCFPVSECPPDGERVDGKASTEIRFNVYEDGSTAGSIQRDKGRFAESYNVSVDSAMLLQAYLAHVIKEARMEYDSGTQDKKSLDQLFQ
jgi:hypothetical protein